MIYFPPFLCWNQFLDPAENNYEFLLNRKWEIFIRLDNEILWEIVLQFETIETIE